jgi:hypothetical protein
MTTVSSRTAETGDLCWPAVAHVLGLGRVRFGREPFSWVVQPGTFRVMAGKEGALQSMGPR